MRNIVLIGMPGVGKSTIGVILAKEIGYQFMDTDLLIQEKEQRRLKDIIASEGVEGFLFVENQVTLSIDVQGCVIATGGSLVYSHEAMTHLRESGIVIYLKLPYEELKLRLTNLKGRGVVLKPGQTLRDIFNERSMLYETYADYIVDESNLNIEETLQIIMDLLVESQNFHKSF